MKIDTIDCRILMALQSDGRVSNQDLADRVALSPSACLRRVRALEEGGLIRGYHAELDAALLGFELEAVVQITLDSGRDHWHEDFQRWVGQVSEVTSAWIVTGDCNYMLMVRTTSLSEFSAFIIEKLNRLPGMRDIRSYVVMRTIKRTPQLEVRPRGDVPGL